MLCHINHTYRLPVMQWLIAGGKGVPLMRIRFAWRVCVERSDWGLDQTAVLFLRPRGAPHSTKTRRSGVQCRGPVGRTEGTERTEITRDTRKKRKHDH